MAVFVSEGQKNSQFLKAQFSGMSGAILLKFTMWAVGSMELCMHENHTIVLLVNK